MYVQFQETGSVINLLVFALIHQDKGAKNGTFDKEIISL